jgi:signal recognition particle GTPase
MRDLFNEMIPEVKELLLADKEKYPNRHESIMDDINKATLITDLTVHTASSLVDYLNNTKVKSNYESFINKLYTVFGK